MASIPNPNQTVDALRNLATTTQNPALLSSVSRIQNPNQTVDALRNLATTTQNPALLSSVSRIPNPNQTVQALQNLPAGQNLSTGSATGPATGSATPASSSAPITGITPPSYSAFMGSGSMGGQYLPTPFTPYTYGMFEQSPEAQLLQGQDVAAINAAQNASSLSGGMNSNNMKALIAATNANTLNAYNTGLQNYINQYLTGNQARQQTYQDIYNIAGLGANAAAGLGGYSGQAAGQMGGYLTGAGQAQAAGQLGVAGALGGAVNQGFNAWLQNQYMNRGGGSPSVGSTWATPSGTITQTPTGTTLTPL